VRSDLPDAPDRLAGAGTEQGVLGDERAVEIDRERGDARREVYGGVPPVAFTT
jgi:hypothetical protein